MTILGIDEISYGAADLATCKRFFGDWGLKITEDTSHSLCFETLDGGRVRVLDPQHGGLPSAMQPGPTLHQVVWGVDSEVSLAALRCKLLGAPGFVDLSQRMLCTDPMGLSVGFQVSPRRKVEVRGSGANPWGARTRVNQASPVYERATPIEIGHVVFFVQDLAATEAFYASLGFITSDRYPGHGAFMRCAARGGHHDLFLLRRPGGGAGGNGGRNIGTNGLNHVAFAVRDIHEVFGGGLHISRCGWPTQLGPGRHPISSAYFWYFKNPAGGLIEYYADDDELTEAWQPRSFTPGPTVFAEWAIAGGIDGHTRRQPGLAADGKFLTEKR